jgi:hypothetical protein
MSYWLDPARMLTEAACVAGRATSYVAGNTVDMVGAVVINNLMYTGPAEPLSPDRVTTPRDTESEWDVLIRDYSAGLTNTVFSALGGWFEGATGVFDSEIKKLVTHIFEALGSKDDVEFSTLDDKQKAAQVLQNLIDTFESRIVPNDGTLVIYNAARVINDETPIGDYHKRVFREIATDVFEKAFPDGAADKNLPPVLKHALRNSKRTRVLKGSVYYATAITAKVAGGKKVDLSSYTYEWLIEQFADQAAAIYQSIKEVDRASVDTLETDHPRIKEMIGSLNKMIIDTVKGISLQDYGLSDRTSRFFQSVMKDMLTSEHGNVGRSPLSYIKRVLDKSLSTVFTILLQAREGQSLAERYTELAKGLLTPLQRDMPALESRKLEIQRMEDTNLLSELAQVEDPFFLSDATSLLEASDLDGDAAKELLIRVEYYNLAKDTLGKELAVDAFAKYFPSTYPASSVFPMLFDMAGTYLREFHEHYRQVIDHKFAEAEAFFSQDPLTRAYFDEDSSVLDEMFSEPVGGRSVKALLDENLPALNGMIQKAVDDGLLTGYPPFVNEMIKEVLKFGETNEFMQTTIRKVLCIVLHDAMKDEADPRAALTKTIGSLAEAGRNINADTGVQLLGTLIDPQLLSDLTPPTLRPTVTPEMIVESSGLQEYLTEFHSHYRDEILGKFAEAETFFARSELSASMKTLVDDNLPMLCGEIQKAVDAGLLTGCPPAVNKLIKEAFNNVALKGFIQELIRKIIYIVLHNATKDEANPEAALTKTIGSLVEAGRNINAGTGLQLLGTLIDPQLLSDLMPPTLRPAVTPEMIVDSSGLQECLTEFHTHYRDVILTEFASAETFFAAKDPGGSLKTLVDESLPALNVVLKDFVDEGLLSGYPPFVNKLIKSAFDNVLLKGFVEGVIRKLIYIVLHETMKNGDSPEQALALVLGRLIHAGQDASAETGLNWLKTLLPVDRLSRLLPPTLRPIVTQDFIAEASGVQEYAEEAEEIRVSLGAENPEDETVQRDRVLNLVKPMVVPGVSGFAGLLETLEENILSPGEVFDFVNQFLTLAVGKVLHKQKGKGHLDVNFLSATLVRVLGGLNATSPTDVPDYAQFAKAFTGKALEAVITRDELPISNVLKPSVWESIVDLGEAKVEETIMPYLQKDSRMEQVMKLIFRYSKEGAAAPSVIPAVIPAEINLNSFRAAAIEAAKYQIETYVNSLKLPKLVKAFVSFLVTTLVHITLRYFLLTKLYNFLSDEASNAKLRVLLWNVAVSLEEDYVAEAGLEPKKHRLEVRKGVRGALKNAGLLSGPMSRLAAYYAAQYTCEKPFTELSVFDPEEEPEPVPASAAAVTLVGEA